jgi:pimeloyl-ACP methyl ester carboxylesterase
VGPRVTAVAIATILVLSACTSGAPQQGKARSGPTPSPTPAAGTVAWTDCGGGFQCRVVTVPLDYAHPAAGTIDIALNRKPATDQANRIGSLLINPGGPGASGVDWVRDSAPALSILNRRFDLIGFDPRGVSRSSPVQCLDRTTQDAYNALDGVLDDPVEKQATIQADKDYVAACAQRSAKILPFLDTESAARDMDLIRAALGDAKLTYLGFSYGTYLGQMYAHLFPTHVRALSLDAVVDPAISLNDLDLAQVVGFEQNLRTFLADCTARKAASPPCEWAQSGDPYAKLLALMQRLDTSPMQVGNRLLTRGLAMTGVLWRVYYQPTWPLLEAELAQIDRGNGALLLASADDYNGRNADGSYTNELDANNSVNCLDHPVPTDIAAYDSLGPAFASASQFFGPWSQYSALTCAYWPVKPTQTIGPLRADGAPPILLVGGTNDPATPYAWAQGVHEQLVGSVLLTRRGNGHGSYGESLCATQAENAYLINLTLPAPGTVCT